MERHLVIIIFKRFPYYETELKFHPFTRWENGIVWPSMISLVLSKGMDGKEDHSLIPY